jgi:hypothetical protein
VRAGCCIALLGIWASTRHAVPHRDCGLLVFRRKLERAARADDVALVDDVGERLALRAVLDPVIESLLWAISTLLAKQVVVLGLEHALAVPARTWAASDERRGH